MMKCLYHILFIYLGTTNHGLPTGTSKNQYMYMCHTISLFLWVLVWKQAPGIMTFGRHIAILQITWHLKDTFCQELLEKLIENNTIAMTDFHT